MSLCFHHITELYYLQVSSKMFYYASRHFNTLRTKENKTHLFIHLNLCIALALGLVVFIAGIENATNNEVTIRTCVHVHIAD